MISNLRNLSYPSSSTAIDLSRLTPQFFVKASSNLTLKSLPSLVAVSSEEKIKKSNNFLINT